MSPPSLLGPPAIRDPNSLFPKPTTVSSPSDPSMDAMVSNFNKSTRVTNTISSPPMGFTENRSATYLSAGNPCLDFFFHVVPSTPKDSLEQRLREAWDHDALTTLKLICNLRGVRGTGKSDKEGFYTAAVWLHGYHPKTLACNLEALSQFGYFKDFPELLYRILQGSEIRDTQKSERIHRHTEAYLSRRARFSRISYGGRSCCRRGRVAGRSGREASRGGGKSRREATRELRVANAERRNQEEKAKASLERKQKKVLMGKDAFTRYSHDADYRFLHERVSELFADHLKRDLEFLTSGETNKISLAAKWCPSLDSSFDKATLLCESIARKIFPRESFPEYQSIEESHYAYRVRDRLRKEVLVPLRKTLQLPEVYMGARNWDSLPYNRVASVAMTSYKEIFLKHDAERFLQYLGDARKGKTKVAAGALLPHEIIRALYGVDGGEVAELQWKRMVEDLKKIGTLANCIAISDVSGSMKGDPMAVSVALGLLISELSEEPWKGKLITFSQDPKLQLVKGEDLRSKTEFVRSMEWGMNTNFQKVFDLILTVAVEGKLKPEDMIKRVFVFSDMEFDQVSPSRNMESGGLRVNKPAGIFDFRSARINIFRKTKPKPAPVPQIIRRVHGYPHTDRRYAVKPVNPVKPVGFVSFTHENPFNCLSDGSYSSDTESDEESFEEESSSNDVGFDQPSRDRWETDYEVIVRKYKESGYGEVVPEIVFWNLRDSRATPVLGNKKGVALVSGFSKNLMKIFLEHDGEIDPMMVMEAAICKDEYKTLVVVD